MLPPAADPWGDGPTGPTVDWRERERRQRSVRLLMMFLLMLILMDSEEQSSRSRRSRYSQQLRRRRRKAPPPLEESVFQARQEQDAQLREVTQVHPRFAELLKLNEDVNHAAQVQSWAEEHVKEDTTSSGDIQEPSASQDEKDSENKKKVFHFPWNATGFYRGEWQRKTSNEEDENNGEKETQAKAVDQNKNDEPIQYRTAKELEGPVEKMLENRKERVGIFLLPPRTEVRLGENFTATKTELAGSEVAREALRTQAASLSKSPWLRVASPELNVVVEKAEDESPPAKVSLTKRTGRAAFHLYSRSIPSMQEMSLVDGFIKLYDSSTVGLSTRRDVLLRVRGVVIHAIGRISLVSNAGPARSALILSNHAGDANNEARHRRLMEAVQSLPISEDMAIDQLSVEQIRDDALDLYPPHRLEDLGTLSEIKSFDLNDFVGDDLVNLGKRNLSVVAVEEESADSEIVRLAQEAKDEETSLASEMVAPRRTKSEEGSQSRADSALPDRSRVVIPYPFAFDDKEESLRKAKTPVTKRMPPGEQILEANAGQCEFEINLDVKEIEWTLGKWKKLISRHVHEKHQLDPSLRKEDPDEENEEDQKIAHEKMKYVATPTKRSRSREKALQDEALVMVMAGSVVSPNCDFSASVNATAIRTDWENTTGKAINYSFYMMLTCLTQIVVLLRQLLHTQAQSAAARVSLMSIGWQTILDALLCLGHVYLSLVIQPLFTAFASVAFFKLLIFCVIEMKYMAIIIQARNNANGGQNTTELLRRQLAMLHLRFYVALVFAFMSFIYAGEQYRIVYILALYSFWVPQIVQNVISEARRPLHPYYIYGMSFTRLVAPLYVFALKDNFLRELYPDAPTDIFMCELLILWVAFQATVLVAQSKYGSRFMIPARFLPPKFDYSRPIPPSMLPEGALETQPPPLVDSERTNEMQSLITADTSPSDRHSTGVARNRIRGRSNSRVENVMTTTVEPVQESSPASTLDCVICYNSIDIHNRQGYMLAPCNHIFHRSCLTQWMEVKMECPVCRKELPSL